MVTIAQRVRSGGTKRMNKDEEKEREKGEVAVWNATKNDGTKEP
jgi:hypothetical protein